MTKVSPSKPTPVSKSRSEKTLGWRVLAGSVIPFILMLARFRIVDGHKLPKTGAFIFAPNHYSEIDPLMMGYVMWKLGRVPRFLAKASIFRIPVIGALMRGTGQIPVERAGSVRGSDPLTAASRLAADGLAVVVYPEGSLSRDPDLWPMRGKTGAVRMALETGVPVIPAAHWGTQLVMARYAKKISLFPRKTIVVKIGDPVDLSQFVGQGFDAKTLNAATAVVMDAITALLEDLRQENAPTERWDPSKKNQSETGRFE